MLLSREGKWRVNTENIPTLNPSRAASRRTDEIDGQTLRYTEMEAEGYAQIAGDSGRYLRHRAMGKRQRMITKIVSANRVLFRNFPWRFEPMSNHLGCLSGHYAAYGFGEHEQRVPFARGRQAAAGGVPQRRLPCELCMDMMKGGSYI